MQVFKLNEKKLKYTPFFAVLSLCLIGSATVSASMDTTYYEKHNINYNICDELFENSMFFVFPYDDWGFKGALSLFGLPGNIVKLYYNSMQYLDPLYGQVPFSWLSTKYSRITISDNLSKCELNTIWPNSEKVVSRFDYYRGDYGFVNFGLMVSGKYSENTRWHFSGENLNYGGMYGLYGAKSLSQLYQLNFKTALDKWAVSYGASYQKYMPGTSTVFPQMEYTGRQKDYRTSAYLRVASNTDKDSLIAGFQISSILYNSDNKNELYDFTGEGSQISGMLRKDFVFKRSKISLLMEPIVQSAYIRNQGSKHQNLYTLSLSDDYITENSKFNFKIGIANKEFIGSASVVRKFSPRARIDINTEKGYSVYPLMYQIPFDKSDGLLSEKEGFSYYFGSIGLDLGFNLIKSRTSIEGINSTLVMPFKEKVEDELVTFREENIETFYIAENLRIDLPWKMSLQGKLIFSPIQNNENCLTLQGWGRIFQQLDLFQDKLSLFFSGDVTYHDGGDFLAWFDELRSYGMAGTSYFTNNRLCFSLRVGAKVNSFHIFYAIYNVEGRAFSSMALMPFRNRLMLYGVQWTFLD